MAHVAPARPADAAYPADTAVDRGDMVRPNVQALPVTPGKVAMWLFLATEIMFFTGLIGSYIVLRAGSPETAYPNIFPPTTDVGRLGDARGIEVTAPGKDVGALAAALKPYFDRYTTLDEEQVEHMLGSGHAVVPGVPAEEAEALVRRIEDLGATAETLALQTEAWPMPYDHTRNPLSIDLTAANTFILICSSVTMVLALAAIQRGDKKRLTMFLAATVLIGATFLGVQVFEYYQLMFGHAYPPGIGADGHFRPYSSLFASCFFTMTGFHGAHVAGGVILLSCILIQSLRGAYTRERHSPVELAGLYWHFVDLVWIILFTVVYLI